MSISWWAVQAGSDSSMADNDKMIPGYEDVGDLSSDSSMADNDSTANSLLVTSIPVQIPLWPIMTKVEVLYRT